MYKNGGRITGTLLIVYPNGDTTCHGTFVDGLLNGRFSANYVGGVVQTIRFYTNGELDGPFSVYYPSGTLKAKGLFRLGQVVGKFTSYHADGSLENEFDFDAQSAPIEGAPVDEFITVVLEDDVGSVRHLEMTLFAGGSLHFLAWSSPIRKNYQLGSSQAVIFRFADGDSLQVHFMGNHREQVVATMGGRGAVIRTALANSLQLPVSSLSKFKSVAVLTLDMVDPFDSSPEERTKRGQRELQTLRLGKRDQRLLKEGSMKRW